MRPPSPPGSPIDDPRLSTWVMAFSGYHDPIDEHAVRSWIAQFDFAHIDLAARILDSVQFYPAADIGAQLRHSLINLPAWPLNPESADPRWRLVPFSSSPGESGDSMLHLLRRSASLSGKAHSPLFIYRSELLRERLRPTDNVVFVDDFAGTGEQAVDAWNGTFSELLPEPPNTYLLLAAATERAIAKIQTSTPLRVATGVRLGPSEDLFSADCTHFTIAEKDAIISYNKRADRKRPRGYGDCGTVVVFAHGAPNNSIPILHSSSHRWQGLFRRTQ